MIRSELFINDTQVELKSEFGCAITYAIADIKHPDSRNGSLSKTVTLPGTKPINVLLTSIYEINYDIQTSGTINFTPDYNPNLKASVRQYTDGELQFTGYMKLLNIIRSQADLKRMDYEVQLFGEVASIYNDMADNKLSDLDLSAYNHTYNKTNQKATWTATTYGIGYFYPMINYGGIPLNTWNVNNFYPAVYHKTIIDAIFSAAGWTYSSTFFDSAFFKRLGLPFCGDRLTLTAAQVTAKLFSSSLSTNIDDSQVVPITATSSVSITDPPVFDTEISDPSNQYDPVIGIFTAATSGYYEFLSSGTVSANATTNVIFTTGATYNIIVNAKKISGATTTIIPIGGDSGLTAGTTLAGNDLYSRSLQIVSPTIYLLAGDTVQLYINQTITHGAGATGTIRFRIASGALFYNRVTNTQITDGNALDFASVMPVDIRQADYLTSIFRYFNLYVEPDKTQPNRLIIETESSFYESGTTRDWSEKLDVSKPVTITPMGALDCIRYRIKHADDTDYWNKLYRDKFKETYGEKNVDIVNDFLKNVNTNEVIFAATPLVGSVSNDRIIPEIYTLTNAGVQQPVRSKLRILYWAGTFNTANSWTYTSSVSGNTTETKYPYAGHLDNPYNPTLDLSFGVPREVYYANPYGTTTYTDKNVYNQYHDQFISEITDKNSKIVTAYFRLTPTDIFNLSFRDIIWIDGMNYRLNKVIDYDPASYNVTKVELLKIKHAPEYVFSIKNLTWTQGEVISRNNPAPGYGGNVGVGDLGNASMNAVVGRDNYISDTSQGSNVSGNGNRIGNNTRNVSVFNSSGVVVCNDLQNVCVVSTNDITITENNVSYLNGIRISGKAESTALTATQTITKPGYYTTTGAITITLSPGILRNGDEFNFVKLDAVTTLTVSGGGVNINGAATTIATAQYSSITIRYNTTANQFYITA